MLTLKLNQEIFEVSKLIDQYKEAGTIAQKLQASRELQRGLHQLEKDLVIENYNNKIKNKIRT